MKFKFLWKILPILLFIFCKSNNNVTFVQKEHQIDVLFNGKLITSYLFKPELTKPILYPILSPSGIVMNRAYPLENLEGESNDHPHHTGMFFTYDEVN